MAYQSQFYTAGTVTVTDGSAIVTGSETGWETALIEGGVFYVLGSAYPILSVEDENKLTLAIPFSGQGAAGLAYAIDRQRSAAVLSIAMNDRLAAIIASIHGAQPESDLLSAFAALQGEDGKLAMFTSENTLSLVDYIADAKGTLAKLAALESGCKSESLDHRRQWQHGLIRNRSPLQAHWVVALACTRPPSISVPSMCTKVMAVCRQRPVYRSVPTMQAALECQGESERAFGILAEMCLPMARISACPICSKGQ